MQNDTLFGNGGHDSLARRVRSHGNFQEYVPLALIVIALIESGGGSSTLVRSLCVALVVARILHPIGMFAPKNSVQQFACRGVGILLTLLVVLVASISLLMR